MAPKTIHKQHNHNKISQKSFSNYEIKLLLFTNYTCSRRCDLVINMDEKTIFRGGPKVWNRVVGWLGIV